MRDPFDPKVVRSTMGSLFNVPLARTSMWTRWRGGCASGKSGWPARTRIAARCGRGAWSSRTALALGNEARGLSDDLAAHVESWVRLPMAGKAESLNVAVAGGY